LNLPYGNAIIIFEIIHMIDIIRKRAIKAEHFANLVAIAYADGYLDDEEKLFLSERAQEIGLSSDEVKAMFVHVDELKFIVPLNQDEVEEQIADMVYMIMADGVVHEKEYKLCLNIAQKLDYSKSDLDYIIDLTRKLSNK
jgi:tellurite resistance protein